MRLFVRRWITEWDLERLYPGHTPEVVVTPVDQSTYADDPDLESLDEPEGT